MFYVADVWAGDECPVSRDVSDVMIDRVVNRRSKESVFEAKK